MIRPVVLVFPGYSSSAEVIAFYQTHTRFETLADRESAWVVQERIAIRREVFPMQTENGVQMRDMLVDFAPYIFRGKMAGCLTRLSSTGLANVTSGGGQVPSFVVEPRQ